MARQAIFTNNALSTLAGAISGSSTTCQVQAGTGTLFPNPKNGQYFTLTLIQAANPTVFEIVWCTDRSVNTLTIVRGKEGTTPQSFQANDRAEHLVTAGSINAFGQTFRIGLFANLTLYVNESTGSNSNDGLSPSTAFKTLQKAVNVACQVYDTAGFTITIQNQANVTMGGALMTTPLFGGGGLIIDGGGFTIAVSNASCFIAFNGGIFTVQNWSATSATGTGSGMGTIIGAANQGTIYVGASMVIGIGANFDFNAQFGGQIFVNNAYTVSAGAHVIHCRFAQGGSFYMNGVGLTLQGAPTCTSEWYNGEDNSVAFVNISSLTGTSASLTGLIEMLSCLDASGNAANLPGNGTITLHSGSQTR